MVRSGNPSVQILLATCNNEAYLRAMLESLAAQTMTDFKLLISDDNSSDGTLRILEESACLFEHPPRIVRRETGSGSAKANFSSLIQIADADFVLFADADDVWYRTKVERTVDALISAQRRLSADIPVYFFTDVRVIDAAGSPLFDSFWSYKRIDPRISSHLSQLLVCPPMLGCASGINAALLERIRPVPVDEVTGHDWWALLTAAVFGEVLFDREPSMSYRLHGTNSSDQKQVNLAQYAVASGRMERVRRGMMLRRQQAQALIDTFGSELGSLERRVVERFVATGQQGFLTRRWTLVTGRYLYPDLPRTAAMLLAA